MESALALFTQHGRVAHALARPPRMWPVELAESLAQDERMLILDVRAKPLLAAHDRRIPGARHVELATLEDFSSETLPADARVLYGGIDAWAEVGLPLETASAMVRPR